MWGKDILTMSPQSLRFPLALSPPLPDTRANIIYINHHACHTIGQVIRQNFCSKSTKFVTPCII